MSEFLLLDTNVLIDYLRSRDEAVEYLEALSEPPTISAVTVAELYAGVRDGKERTVLNELVDKLTVFPITRDVAVKAGLFRRDYFKTHGVGLMDAIIAATAESENAVVVTLNKKHFPMFSTVVVPYVRTQ
ncbi:MAG: type II toxin-antitoxin system VapC family toxin [Pyrinomonadaceae bacterium]